MQDANQINTKKPSSSLKLKEKEKNFFSLSLSLSFPSSTGQALVATINSASAQRFGSPSSSSYAGSTFSNFYSNGTLDLSSLSPLALSGGRSRGTQAPGTSSSSVLASIFDITSVDFRDYLVKNGEALVKFDEARRRQQIGEGETKEWYHGQGLVESMRQVPQMYFREDFVLGEKETYAAVCPQATTSCGGSDAADRQEEMWKDVVMQLSQYVDIVEVNLLREIEARASQFFEAMDIIQKLQRCTSQACLSISITRRGLNQHKKTTAFAMERVQKLQAEKEALESVLRLATDLDATHHANTALNMLQSTSDYASILDVMTSLQNALETSEVRNLDCFRGRDEELTNMRQDLTGNMIADFLRLAKTNRTLDSLSKEEADSLLGDGGGVGDDDDEGEEQQPLSDAMLPLILSLHRTGCLGDAVKAFFNHVEEKLKSSIATFVLGEASLLLSQATANGNGEDTVESSGKNGTDEEDLLPTMINRLSVEEFLALQERMVSSIKSWISKNLGDMESIIESILKESFFVYCHDFQSMEQYLEEVLAGFWAKIFGMRYATHQNYKLHEYLALVDGTRKILEDVQPQKGSPNCFNVVRNAMNNQNKPYLDVLHKYSKTKLISALEQDQWKVAPVSEYMQEVVLGFSNPRQGRRRSDSGSRTIECLVLQGKKFFLVPSTVVFIQTISDLVSYSSYLPQHTTEVTHRMIELFKIYNAMSCNLILGAGAMNSAGLKSISAKHLAAIAQAISFISFILPAIIENLTSKLLPLHQNILMPQFRSLSRDLGEHHSRIEKKLVKIMQDRLLANLRVLVSMAQTWGDMDVAEYKPSQFARTVTKQIDVLKGALCPMLLQEELESIFGDICTKYSETIVKHFKELPKGNKHWYGQLHADAQSILTCLDGLPAGGKGASDLKDFCSELLSVQNQL